MMNEILGLLREFKERTVQSEQYVAKFYAVLVEMGARLHEQHKEIRDLQLRLKLAEHTDVTFAAPYSTIDFLVEELSHKEHGHQNVGSGLLSAYGEVFRVKCGSCGEQTYVCPEVQDDVEKRKGCLMLQGWTFSDSTSESELQWQCCYCSISHGVPRRLLAGSLTCCQSHHSLWRLQPSFSPPRNTV